MHAWSRARRGHGRADRQERQRHQGQVRQLQRRGGAQAHHKHQGRNHQPLRVAGQVLGAYASGKADRTLCMRTSCMHSHDARKCSGMSAQQNQSNGCGSLKCPSRPLRAMQQRLQIRRRSQQPPEEGGV